MDVRVRGAAPAEPFLGAAELFETEYDLNSPVYVDVRENPDERTWAAHYEDRHVLNISQKAATSAMARELVVHELAHMARNEEGHVSHHLATEEALYLALAGESIERHKIAHCYQIANHMKDIYADDITLAVTAPTKLIDFLESELARAVASASAPALSPRPNSRRVTVDADPEITAVNAAFALALVERHDLISADHRLYDLAHAAADDAPTIDMKAFTQHFRSLEANPTTSEYRSELVDATRAYALGESGLAQSETADEEQKCGQRIDSNKTLTPQSQSQSRSQSQFQFGPASD
ncbi:DUF5781 family protein [Haloquadratum walsbyi]|jgi:hypothetical protein|uniref:Uncharacterized protein n=1 Tax=Haloquadratum walsbyi (strain DSM 16790 / HBSQ001) TaxID=362976 RepID=Q18EY1_HALWD|nr:DUF5781 family protein [Haloquadratum walsbyi]CAJ53486.1 uncharacterized protein HQ_3389A [Haloquadratum walsbyi DSM 16790]